MDETLNLTRRNFFKLSGAAALAAGSGAITALPASAATMMVASGTKASLPKAKGPRLVVIGGGTAGLTIAKYAKKAYPKFDVVLVEKRDMYSSCFSSNLWYANLINLEFLANHSFLDAARNNNYIFFQGTCVGLDRAARKIVTDKGEIDYDYLVLTPGIDYDYGRIGVADPETETRLRIEYPAGWTMPTEHVSIRDKIHSFEGGLFIQTVPGGNYRCLPAPYERACMIASYFKKNKVKGKVLVLDHNPDITIKAKGFHAAFDELYKDYIEYKPSAEIKGVDVEKKLIKTEFDTYPFDDAAIYPGVRGARMLETFGLMDPKSPQKEAHIDVLKYHVVGDERVYVAGDSRPMPFSKSANTSNTEGKYVARVIAAHAQGKNVDKGFDWESPRTICYSMVSADPMEAISVDAGYVYDAAKKSFSFSPDTKLYENRDTARGRATLEWAQGIYRDLFA
jgi:sulfide dehydrogenase [flavocytochrome c] flavoprotein subunit